MKPSPTESTTAYLTGFALALSLTVLAFMLVGAKTGITLGPLSAMLQAMPSLGRFFVELPRWVVLTGIFALAVIQIGVHLRYFLHLDFSPKQKPMVQALLFSLLIIFIVVCGTLWIMHDLDRQMMPG